jgi:hypothetical protein
MLKTEQKTSQKSRNPTSFSHPLCDINYNSMLDIPNARRSTYLIEMSHNEKHSPTIDLM